MDPFSATRKNGEESEEKFRLASKLRQSKLVKQRLRPPKTSFFFQCFVVCTNRSQTGKSILVPFKLSNLTLKLERTKRCGGDSDNNGLSLSYLCVLMTSLSFHVSRELKKRNDPVLAVQCIIDKKVNSVSERTF